HSVHGKTHIGHGLLSRVRQMITGDPIDAGDDLRRAAAFGAVQDANRMQSGELGHSVSRSRGERRHKRAVSYAIVGVTAGIHSIKAIASPAFELDMRACLSEDAAKDSRIDNIYMHAGSSASSETCCVVQSRAALINTVQRPRRRCRGRLWCWQLSCLCHPVFLD